MIGENDKDRDEHYSPLGRVPGFYLQANYIEALLDDRYFRPGGGILDYGFGFLFLLGLELILILDHQEVARAISSIVGLILLSYAALYVIIMHIGIYVNPVPVGVTALAIKILHLAYSHVQREPQPKLAAGMLSHGGP